MSAIDTLINNTIREDVRAIAGYHVADASGYIKLDAMENPYHLPDPCARNWAARLADAVLNRYPVASYASSSQRVRDKLGVPAGYDVILGNGSDEFISILCMACAQPGAPRRRGGADAGLRDVPALGPVCRHGLRRRAAQSRPDARPAGHAGRDRRHKPSLVFLAYPNNPTGNLFDAKTTSSPSSGRWARPASPWSTKPTSRSPSKASCTACRNSEPGGDAHRVEAGTGRHPPRLHGGRAAMLAQFDKVRPPYNINVLTQVAAEFALDHVEVLNQQAAALRAARADLAAALAAMPGVEVFPSARISS
jgi:histidinol-phosphate aminotransferase